MTDLSKIDRTRAPLFEAMAAHYRRNAVSFHVPGHKSGAGVDPAASFFYEAMLAVDYTEITGLDDLHQAEGVILEAQRLAAECFGAEETYFLVGGSTVGNLSMITAVCNPEDLILVQRNVHKSVIHGLMLAGARAVFIPPMWDAASGMATGVKAEDVETALQAYPEAKGLLISNPNYYGMGVDVRSLAELLHAHNKPLLVDEAHGAHFGFHQELPPSALSSGADVVVQSTHKMLTAMTMGAMLHVQGDLVDRTAIQQRLSLLQSSSPSYPILGSLDLARRQVHMNGEAWIERGLQVLRNFSNLLCELPCYGVICQSLQTSAYRYKDPFKVGIYDATGTLSGPALREKLEDAGCFVEMTDAKHVLLLFTPASTNADVQRVYQALSNICRESQLEKKELSGFITNIDNLPPFTQISSPVAFKLQDQSSFSKESAHHTELVTLEAAVGRRSADMVIPYPPGIPLLYSGEIITKSCVQYLQELASLGIKFQGTQLSQLHKIRVYIK
ncbi:aminotransferase class I/II-fold pyridoxal phosphate-dependent enzyme [Paenibacillus eucommiae]|uniref:Arginine/lysine/ornithine decarboxylase n=1 Tax=Paenibacillus eucommiae TaxID=1355755 RepID=A0ABS4J8N2_9BACL|nr:aminotransferase class I/II-fold pyridoxal phosphate-dependent enzyme [Paenibacillus eucommiae]MBP1996202.1 arginine/lysine/ornithine decarboxylase [Paenibacillus eucommiae]